jgi:hypothetical protein
MIIPNPSVREQGGDSCGCEKALFFADADTVDTKVSVSGVIAKEIHQ